MASISSAVTLHDANRYFAGTLRNDEWQDVDPHTRDLAISEAAMYIGRLRYYGAPAQNVNNAIFEQALCLINTRDDTVGTEIQNAIKRGVTSRSIDGAGESYSAFAKLQDDPGWIDGFYYCPAALAWLSGYLKDRSSVKTGRLVGARHEC